MATIVSPFLADRAWGGAPEVCGLIGCLVCGVRFFDRRLGHEEALAYYAGYRNSEYLKWRAFYEPFYTCRFHAESEAWLASPLRSRVLLSSLVKSTNNHRFDRVLDWGGGNGSLLSCLAASCKAVYDLGNSRLSAGIVFYDDLQDVGFDWDLITCAQVLEHLSDPYASVCLMRDYLKPGAILYLEVPDQHWRDGWQPRLGRCAWLRFLCRHPKLLKLADCVSTACRVKFGWVPPYGFVPMREHINFFTLSSLASLLERAGFEVLLLERNALGCLTAVARSPVIQPLETHTFAEACR